MYIISNNSKPIQTVSIALYLLILSGFLFSFLADKNIFTFILLLCSIGLVIYMNIVYSKQFDIKIENGLFVINNLYKGPIKIDVELYQNVTAVERVFSPFKSDRYALNFKNGASYIFITKDLDLQTLFKDQRSIAAGLTQQIAEHVKSITG